MMGAFLRAPRSLLLASVSSVAIAIAASDAVAADMATKAPPLAPAPPTPWTWWIEGGAQRLDGNDPYVPGLNSPAPFATPAQQWGWSAAIGVDYRLDAFWHVSADFRYAQNKKRGSNSFPGAVFGVPSSSSSVLPFKFHGTNSASRDEYNWATDFMAGRDIGLGGGPAQFKFGVRVAQIRGKTAGTAAWNVPNVTFSACSGSTCPLRQGS